MYLFVLSVQEFLSFQRLNFDCKVLLQSCGLIGLNKSRRRSACDGTKWGREWEENMMKERRKLSTNLEIVSIFNNFNNLEVFLTFLKVTGCSLNIVFFLKILKYSGLWSFFVFPLYQCVYTHQAGRTPALQQNWQSSKKSQSFKEKTQYLMNTL